jgi:serine/threonine-protein kinase RsbW
MNKSFSISSNQEGVNRVEQEIDHLFQTKKLDEVTYGNVLVAVSEAIQNAVIHGNQKKEDKKVNISYSITESNASFTIKDQGNGFDHTNVPDPTRPENIEKLDGRGIFTMKMLSDDISFEDNGRVVKLDFNISREVPA